MPRRLFEALRGRVFPTTHAGTTANIVRPPSVPTMVRHLPPGTSAEAVAGPKRGSLAHVRRLGSLDLATI